MMPTAFPLAAPAVAAAAPSLTQVFLSETLGTAILTLLGCGVVAGVVLPRTKSNAGGWIVITFGWGFAVFAGVYAAYRSGAHLNPAVTVGLWASGAAEYAPGVPVGWASTFVYGAGQLLGAFLGAVVMFVAYKKHFDEEAPAADKLAVFATAPEIRSVGWNVATEVIATFVLVYLVLRFGNTPAQIGPLAVALVVVGIGLSLGGPTGYAINPVRDLGPRIAHALLPVRGKGGSDWSYAWVPIVAPILGGLLAGWVSVVF